MDAEILEFPAGFNVYGSGKRISGNRTTSKNWKHMLTVIMGLIVSISKMFLVYAPCSPHTEQGHSSQNSPPTPRPQGWLVEHWSLFLVTCSQIPRFRASPRNGGRTWSSAHGVSSCCMPQEDPNEAHLVLAPFYGTQH